MCEKGVESWKTILLPSGDQDGSPVGEKNPDGVITVCALPSAFMTTTPTGPLR